MQDVYFGRRLSVAEGETRRGRVGREQANAVGAVLHTEMRRLVLALDVCAHVVQLEARTARVHQHVVGHEVATLAIVRVVEP